MKKNKLNLEKLKVESFITKEDAKDINKVKGGFGSNPCSVCCIVDIRTFCCDRLTDNC